MQVTGLFPSTYHESLRIQISLHCGAASCDPWLVGVHFFPESTSYLHLWFLLMFQVWHSCNYKIRWWFRDQHSLICGVPWGSHPPDCIHGKQRSCSGSHKRTSSHPCEGGSSSQFLMPRPTKDRASYEVFRH